MEWSYNSFQPAQLARAVKAQRDFFRREIFESELASMMPPSAGPFRATILIAIEDAETRTSVCDILNANGYRIELATSAYQPGITLQPENFDLVILDWKLATLDETEIAARLKLLSKNGLRTILAIIDREDDFQIDQLLQAGVDDYLVKPVRAARLGLRAARLVEISRARNAVTRRRNPASPQESSPPTVAKAVGTRKNHVLCEVDADGKLQHVHQELVDLLGYDAAELSNHALDEFMIPGAGAWNKLWLSSLLENGTAQLGLTTKDNRHISATISATRKVDAAGHPLGAELRLLSRHDNRPIRTEYAHMQIALKQRERELAALNAAGRAITSSLNFQHVLEMVAEQIQTLLAADAVCVLMRDPAASDLVIVSTAGIRSLELEGTRLSAATGVAGWIIREREALILADAQTDPRFDVSLDHLMGIITRSLIAVPLKSKGAMWGIVQAVDRTADRFDWHHQEILESLTNWASIAIENANLFQSSRERLRRLQEAHARLALSEKMAALGRLAASLAHEINNPLQSIGMCLALIEESIGEREDAGDLRMDLGIAKSEVQRLSTLMQQLRDYYRPESASRQSTDVGQLLRNVLHLTSYQLNNANISVELGGEEDLPHIELNRNQLYQVLLNLVINAIDAMPDGGTLKINTAWQKGTGDLPPIIEIRIQDSGVGISAEDLPRIFEPFFSTKKTGSGLGLSISYEIINSFGGNIAVSSSPGSGTIFTVSLPVLSSQ